MQSDSENEIDCSAQSFEAIRRYSLETEEDSGNETENDEQVEEIRPFNFFIEFTAPSSLQSENLNETHHDIETCIWNVPEVTPILTEEMCLVLQPDFNGEIEVELQPDFNGELEVELLIPSENLDEIEYSGNVDFEAISWFDSEREAESRENNISEDHRLENLQMFEDSDYDFDDDVIVQNDILLPNLLDENGEITGYENDAVEILANDDYQFILENLNERERMIGEEILLGEPNFWSGAAEGA